MSNPEKTVQHDDILTDPTEDEDGLAYYFRQALAALDDNISVKKLARASAQRIAAEASKISGAQLGKK